MPAAIADASTAIPLESVQPGDSGRLVVQGAANATIQRLMAMGLMPGALVKVVRVAPLGDPIVMETHGFQVSLRKREAHGLAIEGGARAGFCDVSRGIGNELCGGGGGEACADAAADGCDGEGD